MFYYGLSGMQTKPFAIEDDNGVVTYYTFAEWQAITGFDTNSEFVIGLPPDNVKIINNEYDNERLIIAIENYSNQNSFSIDLSAYLIVGRQYKIRCCTQMRQSKSFVYDGSWLSISMLVSDWQIETPKWWNDIVADAGIWYETSLPRFGAFIIQRL